MLNCFSRILRLTRYFSLRAWSRLEKGSSSRKRRDPRDAAAEGHALFLSAGQPGRLAIMRYDSSTP